MPSLPRIIAPAPRNPTPVTICAAMRPGSAFGVSVTEVIVNTAQPRAIRIFVLNPALLWCSSRSAPSRPPMTAASTSLWMSSVSVSICGISLARHRAGGSMLWTIVVLLLILWMLGFTLHVVAGGLIHILLVIALIVIVIRLLTGRRV